MRNGKVKFEKNRQIYKFKIGDNAENERCVPSRIQKGRSHVYLMRCKRGEEFYRKNNLAKLIFILKKNYIVHHIFLIIVLLNGLTKK